MYTDILGKQRMKIGLHMHTTVSDGVVSIEEALEIYKNAGYDAVAVTDHWIWHPQSEYKGMHIISGCEYNNCAGDDGRDSVTGVYHILGIGCENAPKIEKTVDGAQDFIDKIHSEKGLAILAHPAWSLNSVEQVKSLSGIDATEIYNTVSGVHASNRPYSGTIVDLLANSDCIFPLTAADDSHFYDGEHTKSYIMLDVSDSDLSDKDIIKKIKAGDFYATQGPEVHMEIADNGNIIVRTSPASCITFYSNSVYNPQRTVRGENLTYAEYPPRYFEKWVRAEVYDSQDRCAWSNIIRI